MLVWFDIARGDGRFEPDGLPWEFEPDKNPDLRELGDALAYLARAGGVPEGATLREHVARVEGPNVDQLAKVLAVDGGPPLSFADLNLASWLDHHLRTLWNELPDAAKDETQGLKLLSAADAAARQAYLVGRFVREAELKADYEAKALHSLGLPRAGGEARKAAADKWRVPALDVARRARSAKPSLSQESVAKLIEGAGIEGLPERSSIVAEIRKWEGEWRASTGERGLPPRVKP
ncbi:MAG: hypothetical protein ABS78_10575 [Phenylobacterium sp. SCN 70-31]|nr:MAG: hypothetical protein ABS78_10575 [Phenylobacterium sp. SCN 70-31]